MPRPTLFLAGVLLLLVPTRPALGAEPATPPPAPAISPDARPWTRWWWPGSAVDRAGLTRQLEAFARAGLGGVEITPIYGTRGAEDRAIPFLSSSWMEMLEHTTREAKRLGLGVDMATGTGWPFGGPWVAPSDAAQKLILSDGQLAGTPTKMQVKRAAPGAQGLVIDPYSPAALERYLAPFTSAFASFPAGLVRAQFHDSFEYYDAGWTPELPAAFRQMHGYDLQAHAAELMGASPTDPETLTRLKADYRATLARLHLDYLKSWRNWSHRHGFIVRNQSHGAPANLLDLYGAVDIPETETFGSTPFPIPGLRREWTSPRDLPDSLVLRLASSAAHVMGRPLVSSETCTWLREHWQESLAFTKPEIDRLFADGINHIFYHGSVYSPPDAAWPGWLFYASTQFNPNNPWWQDFAALNRYVARIQTVLQSGRPDNDILLYWPFDDVLHQPDGTGSNPPKNIMRQYGVHGPEWLRESPFGRLADSLLAAGYAFDYISDSQLLSSRTEAGTLLSPGGNHYRVIVVPATGHMPPETLAHLAALARDGATVLFEALPRDVPGLGRLEPRRTTLRTLLADPVLAACVRPVLPALAAFSVPREAAPASGLRFTRRAHASGHDYFFANLTDRTFDGWLPLGTAARAAVLTDPLDGRSGRAALRPGLAPEVFLQLAPGQSILLRTFDGVEPAETADWSYAEPAGAPAPITGSWSIEFLQGGPSLPPALHTSVLKSWTELGGEELRNFSGTARYRIEFDTPPTPAATDWMLDLGDVRESARVKLNGTDLGTAWSLPFRLRAGSALRPGRNVLELEVTNLAANRIRDLDRRKVNWKIMHEINFVDIHYKPFDASNWPDTPSGLLGPITLTPLRSLSPR